VFKIIPNLDRLCSWGEKVNTRVGR